MASKGQNTQMTEGIAEELQPTMEYKISSMSFVLMENKHVKIMELETLRTHLDLIKATREKIQNLNKELVANMDDMGNTVGMDSHIADHENFQKELKDTVNMAWDRFMKWKATLKDMEPQK